MPDSLEIDDETQLLGRVGMDSDNGIYGILARRGINPV